MAPHTPGMTRARNLKFPEAIRNRQNSPLSEGTTLMDVNHINPFVKSAINVFNTMLGCPIQREGVALKDTEFPSHDVTSVIGLTGVIRGSVVFSVSSPVAFKIVEALLGVETHEINSDVVDAVGEVTNMIVGGAKADLAQFRLSLGLPTVIVGKDHTICFAENVRPLCILFRTPWGPTSLEIALEMDRVAAVERTLAEVQSA
jgi:chemotaxis protein CheX